MADCARLEIVCALKGYRGFESLPLRQCIEITYCFGIIKLGTKYLLTADGLGLPYCSVKWTPGSSRVGPPAE